MKKLRLGVIGLGSVAQIFHLPFLSKCNEVEIGAVCDKDLSRAKPVAERFGIERVYSNYKDLLEREELDAVDICTSTDSHFLITMDSIKSGKDVFVEKPIARHFDEALKISEAVKEHKRNLMVGMNYRFRSDTMILKSIIEKGEIGKIFFVKAGWLKKLSSDSKWITKKDKSGGGVFLDLGIVLLDLVLWMLNFPPVQRVDAKMYRHKTKTVEDTSIVFAEIKYGVSLVIETSWSYQYADDFFYCELFGSEGTAIINPLRIHKKLHGNLVTVSPVKIGSPLELLRKSYESELKHFIGAARGIHPLISTGEEAVQRMKVVEAIYQSAAIGKEIIIK